MTKQFFLGLAWLSISILSPDQMVAQLEKATSGAGDQVSPANDAISSITFDTIPAGYSLKAATIDLIGDVRVEGNVSVNGLIQPSSQGIEFPDGSIQVTACTTSDLGSTANAGLYSNVIVEMTPPEMYTEICIKDGSVLADIHVGGESSAGGNCIPGDTGWIIERDQRAALTWPEARMKCLTIGMRLPEMFDLSILATAKKPSAW